MDLETQDFILQVEEYFCRRRGRALLLSPKDVARAAQWHREGVPLPVVQHGIDRYFERMAARPDGEPRRERAVSLAYCERDVRDCWKQHQDLERPGGAAAEGPSREEIGRKLRAFADRLAEAAAHRPAGSAADRSVEVIQRELEALIASLAASEATPPADLSELVIEETLARLDRQLLEAMEAALPVSERTALAATVEAELKPYRPRLEEEVLERVRRDRLHDRLRERYHLPRLSLWYA